MKTPQPTPISLSSNRNASCGTKSRVSRLRQECLKRDNYRCVVSRKFDRAEAKKRLEKDETSKDDDGELLRNQRSDQFEYLEVAHIIPHSLATLSSEESELVCGILKCKVLWPSLTIGIERVEKDGIANSGYVRPRHRTSHRGPGDR